MHTNTNQPDEFNYKQKLTSLLYERKRHDWNSDSCQQLINQLLNHASTPVEIKEALRNQEEAILQGHIFFHEAHDNRYYGENLSDDSDSEEEEKFDDEIVKDEEKQQKDLLKKASEDAFREIHRDLGKLQGLLKRIPVLSQHYERMYQKFFTQQIDNQIFQNNLHSISMLREYSFRGALKSESLEKKLYDNTYQLVSGPDLKRKKRVAKKALFLLLDDPIIVQLLCRHGHKDSSDIISDFRILFSSLNELMYAYDKIYSQEIIKKMPFITSYTQQHKNDLDILNQYQRALIEGKSQLYPS